MNEIVVPEKTTFSNTAVGARASLIVTSDEPWVRGNLLPAFSGVEIVIATDSSPATPSQLSSSAERGFTSDDGSRAILFVRDMPVSFFQFGADCTFHGEAVVLREVDDDSDSDD